MFQVSIEASMRGTISGPMTDRFLRLSRDFPGKIKWVGRTLTFDVTAANLEFVFENFPPENNTWDSSAKQELEKILQLRAFEVDAMNPVDMEELRSRVGEFKFKTQPYDHQLHAFLEGRDREAYGLFMEMGTGKTKVLCDIAAYRYLKNEINLLVVLAPNGVHRQWIREQLPVHMACEYDGHVYSAGKLNKLRQRVFDDLMKDRSLLRVVAMNIESLSFPVGREFLATVMKGNKVMLVVDESSKIKTPGSNRTKNIVKLGASAVCRYVATGTPITQGAQDLYSQFLFLNPKILGFNSFYTFRNHFCWLKQIPGAPKGAQMIVGYKNLEELKSRVRGHTFQATKDECLDLPEKIFTFRDVELTPEQTKIYTDVKEQLVMEFDSGVADMTLAITRLMRLQQVLSGYLPTDGGIEKIPTNRLTALMDIMEEIDGRAIIWARFQHDIESIAEIFKANKIPAVTYYGATSQADRTEAIRLYREEGYHFIGNPATAGVGLDLVGSTNTIWYSSGFELEYYLQANDRNHRIGTKSAVTYVHMRVPGAIDDKVWQRLIAKKAVADKLLDVRNLLGDLND